MRFKLGSLVGFWAGLRARVQERWPDLKRPASIALLIVGAAGLIFRVVVARWSHGSNDINIWASFCRKFEEHHSLGWLYDNEAYFNHPPVMASIVIGFHKLFLARQWRFDFMFKLPQIGADVLAAILIYRSWRTRDGLTAAAAFALFSWNPGSFLISAHHGNTDPMVAALSLLAAYHIDRRRAFWGGLALAAAINVKLVPVLLIPVYLSCLTSRRELLKFLLALSLGAIPFSHFVFYHWEGFNAHVLQYRSFPGVWGIPSFLEFLGQSHNFGKLSEAVMKFWVARGSQLVMLVPVLLAVINWRRKRIWSAIELGALVYTSFLVLTAGFGVQYIVYPIPFLFAVDIARACAWSASSGLCVFVVYYSTWTGTQPYFSNFYTGYPIAGKMFGHVAWLILAATLVRLLTRRRRPEAVVAPASAQPVAKSEAVTSASVSTA